MYKKTKGMMMGGAMKAKGMKKGGKVKSAGGMRKPSAKNSGLFGRVKKMSQGGSSLSPAQQRMLQSAQGYAQDTGQNPAELQRLTARYGNLNAAKNKAMAEMKRGRRQQGAPRRGRAPGMKGGGPIGGKKKK